MASVAALALTVSLVVGPPRSLTLGTRLDDTASVTTLDVQLGRKLGAVAFSHDGELVAWAADNEIKVASVYSERVRWSKEDEKPVHALAFSPKDDLLVAGEDGAVRVRSVANGVRVSDYDLVMPDLVAGTVAISCSETEMLAVGTEFGHVLVRPLRNPAALHRWDAVFLNPRPGVTQTAPKKPKMRPLTCVAFSHAGDMIATAGFDHEVRIWSLPDEKFVHEFVDFDNVVNTVAFSPNGGQIAVGCQDGDLKAFSLIDEHCLWTSPRVGPVRGVAFAPGGKWLGAASDGRTDNIVAFVFPPPPVSEWGERPMLHAEPLRHKSPVTAFAISPKGDRIVTASEDETVRLWRISWLSEALVTFTVNDTGAMKSLQSKTGKQFLLHTTVGDETRTFSLSAEDILNSGNGRILPLSWRAPSRNTDLRVSAQLLLGTKNDEWNGTQHTRRSEGIAHVGSDEVSLKVDYRSVGEASESGKPVVSASVKVYFFQGGNEPR